MMLPNGEIIISQMSPYDLRNLIQTGEGTFLEFKRTVPTPKKMAREIAAFANSKGGTILIGVDDNHDIIGVNEYFEEEFQLLKAANEWCVPAVPIKIELIHIDGTEVLIVHVPESIVKPIYNKNKKKRRVYVRRKDSSVLASDEVTEVLKQTYSEKGVTFEYGKNEQILFRYLKEYGEITVLGFANLINQTSYRASKILVNLVSAGILKLFTKDEVDYYTFSHETK